MEAVYRLSRAVSSRLTPPGRRTRTMTFAAAAIVVVSLSPMCWDKPASPPDDSNGGSDDGLCQTMMDYDANCLSQMCRRLRSARRPAEAAANGTVCALRRTMGSGKGHRTHTGSDGRPPRAHRGAGRRVAGFYRDGPAGRGLSAAKAFDCSDGGLGLNPWRPDRRGRGRDRVACGYCPCVATKRPNFGNPEPAPGGYPGGYAGSWPEIAATARISGAKPPACSLFSHHSNRNRSKMPQISVSMAVSRAKG